jgi:hypothetical protein
VVTASSLVSITRAAGGNTDDLMPYSCTSRELTRFELRHEDDGCAETEREQDLIDARPERERHRDEVGHRGVCSGCSVRAGAAQGGDDAVEDLADGVVAQHDGFRRASGAGR